MKKIVLLGAVAAAALAGSASAQPFGGRARLTIFEGPNFTGRSFTIDSDATNFNRDVNDRAQSVRVEGRWTVCADSDFRGRCVTLDRDVRDLRSIYMDRVISSARLEYDGGWSGGGGGRPGGGGWGGGRPVLTLYEGPNFSGRSFTIDSEATNITREFNDRAMSARVRGSWSVCADSDFRGRCVTLDRDIANLGAVGMNRVISSARADDFGGPGGGWGGGGRPPGGGGGWGRSMITIYEGPNFTGRSFTLDSEATNLTREFNDRAMSVRVQGAWSLCADSDFRGRCVTVDRDVRDLRSIYMDRTISSMRPVR